jgi:hypothetical protein
VGGFGADPGQVEQGSGEGSTKPLSKARSSSTGCRRRFWCKARSSSRGFRRRVWEKVWEALVQSQVGFNRVPEKVPEKVCIRVEIPEKILEKKKPENPEKVPRNFDNEIFRRILNHEFYIF